jgi:hypothetical protein
MQDVAARHALRDRFVTGHAEIVEFLRQKWQRELNYTLRKEMWACTGNQGQAVSRVAETSRPVAVPPVPRQSLNIGDLCTDTRWGPPSLPPMGSPPQQRMWGRGRTASFAM